MRSLRYKILAVATALVLLSQAGTVMTVLVTANRDVAERARQRLETGRRLFEQTVQARTSQLSNTVRVLSADYAFKQAVASHDIDTIASALTNHAKRAGTGIAYLMDEDGSIVATSETAVIAKRSQSQLVRLANENGVAHSVTVHKGRAYEFITVPVRAPLPIGWVSMGFPLDDTYMHQIEDLTGLHASLVSRTTGTPVLVASPLNGPIRNALADASGEVDRGQTSTVNIAGSDYLLLTEPLLPDYGELAVVLTESLSEAMAPYRLLRTAAFFLGTLPVVLALVAAALLSRALTRPVQQLAEAARRMKIGDYSQQVSVTTGDELAELALTFNAMQDDIARREARITHQARHDSLTGLPNRDFALKQVDICIATAAQEGGHVAVMVLSLNGSTEIATSLGHDIADSYVRQAAEQLQVQIEHGFMLARLENDSFLLVMPGLDAPGAADMAEHLLKSLESGIGLPNVTVHARPCRNCGLPGSRRDPRPVASARHGRSTGNRRRRDCRLVSPWRGRPSGPSVDDHQ